MELDQFIRTEICQGPLASACLPSQGLNPSVFISKLNFRQIWIYDFYYTAGQMLHHCRFPLFNSLLPWAQMKTSSMLAVLQYFLGKPGQMGNSKSRKHFRSSKHMEKPMNRGHDHSRCLAGPYPSSGHQRGSISWPIFPKIPSKSFQLLKHFLPVCNRPDNESKAQCSEDRM